jgi:ribosome biogenesis GTPase
MSLESFGWDRLGRPTPTAPLQAARVVAATGDILTIATATGLASAIVPGRLQYMAHSALDLPTVGDWVAFLPGGTNVVDHVLPRSTQLIRKAAGRSSSGQILAANVDVVFIVTSANDEFNLRRLERYLTTVHASGARPVIVVNKTDLPGSADVVAQARTLDPDLLALSAVPGDNLDAFDAALVPGATHVFIGSSGVGKSTLINHVLGRQTMRTHDLKRDDTGQHTTTHRELIVADSGIIVIDTPGIRELGVWADDGLEATFADVTKLMGRCRFRDCSHDTEPGCAIQAAITAGELDWARWLSYGKLEREVRRSSGRVDTWQVRKQRRTRAKRIKRATQERNRQGEW